MNQLQLYETLKGMPKDVLLKYAQNPTGNVPQYMAIAALEYQKELQNSKPAPAPQGTVKDKVVQEASGIAGIPQGAPTPQMEQGVAALPVPETMFQEKGMAGGGIIAFDDGGDVKGFAGPEGSLVQSRNQALREIDAQIMSLTSKMRELGGFFGLSQQSPEQQRRYDALQGELDVLRQKRSEIMSSVAPAQTSSPLGRALFGAPEIPGPDFTTVGNMVSDLPSVVATPDQAPPAPPAAPTALDKGIGGLRRDVPVAAGIGIPKAAQIEAEEIKERPALTIDELKRQQQDAYAAYGVDPEFFKKQQETREEERKALENEKTDAKWMSVMQAGLAMASGTSPYALQNIAQGATKGLETYRGEIKDIKKRDEALKESITKSQEAEYLAARGDATGAQKAIRDRDDANYQVGVKNVEIRNNVAAKNAEFTNRLIEQGMESNAAITVASIRAAVEKDYTSAIRRGQLDQNVGKMLIDAAGDFMQRNANNPQYLKDSNLLASDAMAYAEQMASKFVKDYKPNVPAAGGSSGKPLAGLGSYFR